MREDRKPESLEQRVALFEGMVRCCYPVQFWEYDSDLKLQTPVSEQNELLTYLFRYSTAFSSLDDYMKKGERMPALIHSREGLYWMVDFAADEEGQVQRVYLMGPFAMEETSKQRIRQRFELADHPLEVYRRLTISLNHIPVIPLTYMFQYTMMLHYAIGGEKISVSDIRRPFVSQRKTDIFEAEENEEEPAVRHSGVWQAEQQLMQAVRTGNTDYREYIDQAAIISSGVKSKDQASLRTGKNSVILFVGLCSRAAIAGGLPPEISYDMCDRYVEMVESSSSASEVIYASDMMLDDYIHKVHSYRQGGTVSKPVKICCDYIQMHLSEDLSFEKLAKVCGYTEYYLSRKFKRETGISLGEYILHARLDQACVFLRTTACSIQDISDSLNFSSRSYFSTAFQKYIGMSPKAYREKAGVQDRETEKNKEEKGEARERGQKGGSK